MNKKELLVKRDKLYREIEELSKMRYTDGFSFDKTKKIEDILIKKKNEYKFVSEMLKRL